MCTSPDTATETTSTSIPGCHRPVVGTRGRVCDHENYLQFKSMAILPLTVFDRNSLAVGRGLRTLTPFERGIEVSH